MMTGVFFSRGVAGKGFQHLDTVHPRHHDVQQYGVVGQPCIQLPPDHVDRLDPIIGRVDGIVAEAAKAADEDVSVVSIVVDHQQPGGTRHLWTSIFVLVIVSIRYRCDTLDRRQKETGSMEMRIETLSPGVAKAILTGRLDAAGAERIETQLHAIAGSHHALIVDMAAVDFLASIGIRTLMLGAKVMQRRGGQLILLAPQSAVLDVLEVTGVLDMLPVALTPDEATMKIGA